MSTHPGKVRIIACPPGEAPQDVREAWIGLELPLPAGPFGQRRVWLTSGVVTGSKTGLQRLLNFVRGRVQVHKGYSVDGLEAVNVLALKDPVAADWWRENCAHVLDGKRRLVFPADVCQECE
jgi:hypothetical protein